MRWLVVFAVACGASSRAPAPKPAAPWPVPPGWRSEVIPFPLEFAPAIKHIGVEELRFPKGFFEPGSAEYWSYAFVWRTKDAAVLDANALGAELTAYFRGLIVAVDGEKKRVTDPEAIVATAVARDGRFALTAHVIDAFKTGQPVDLVGWAERQACGTGALWIFVLAPERTSIGAQLDELATAARTTCGRG